MFYALSKQAPDVAAVFPPMSATEWLDGVDRPRRQQRHDIMSLAREMGEVKAGP